MTTLRRPIILVFALVLALALAVTVSAQGATKRVALVIQFPNRSYTEIVTVPVTATTADALKEAAIPVGIAQLPFGPGLCNIDGVGNPVDDCFADPAHFWAYFHLNGAQWDSALTGIGGYVPADEAVEGFAWSGFDENFNPTVKPPVKTFSQIEAELTPAPPPNEVPEPATIVLLGGGLTALAAYARKRRAAHS